MSKRDKILYTLFAMIISLIGAAFTYGYFTVSISNNDRQEASVTTGDMVLTFADQNAGFDVKLGLGESVTKTFTIENTGSLNTYASISWLNMINTYMEGSLTYILSYSALGNNENLFDNTMIASSNKNIPRSEVPLTEKLCDPIPVPANTKYYFTLTITFNDIGVNQNADLNAIFNTRFTLNEENMYDTIMLSDRGSSVTNTTPYLKGPIARNTIESIEMMTSSEVPSDAIGSWDVSYYKNKSVIAWYKDIDSNGLYEVYIGQDGGVQANPNSSYLFSKLTKLKGINLDNFSTLYENTPYVYDIGGLFQMNLSLTNLDLSNFYTKKVNNMRGLFMSNVTSGNMQLQNINFGENWDTGNVINMRAMFQDCANITNLNVDNWNTSNVMDMSAMFCGTSSLTKLDLNNWNTSKVINMQGLFAYNGSVHMNLAELQISNFDTSKVTNMKGLFNGCNKIELLDLSSWDTSTVNNTVSMFANTTALKNIKLNKANFNNVTDYTDMFKNSGIENITINPISQTFINNRLTEAGLTPTITLAQ